MAQVAQLQAERSALAAQSEQHRSGLEAKTGDIARMAGQLADAQAQSHSMSQQVLTGPPKPFGVHAVIEEMHRLSPRLACQ